MAWLVYYEKRAGGQGGEGVLISEPVGMRFRVTEPVGMRSRVTELPCYF